MRFWPAIALALSVLAPMAPVGQYWPSSLVDAMKMFRPPLSHQDWLTLPVIVSALSFGVAVLSLYLTYRQRRHQDQLTTRKALTDTVAAIVAANIEFAKQPFGAQATDESMELRRQINSQRRFLSHHGALLLKEIPKLATDVDYQVVGFAFSNHDRATAERAGIKAAPIPQGRGVWWVEAGCPPGRFQVCVVRYSATGCPAPSSQRA